MVMRQRSLGQLVIILVLFCESSYAKDFGIKGHTHKIAEQPFLQMMDDRSEKVNTEELKEKMQSIAKERIENPKPVESVNPASEGRVFYYDPTYTAPDDVYLPCGKLLHKAGKTVNPLEFSQLDRRLFFIDARVPEQIKWLKARISNSEKTESVIDKIILVAGSPLKLQKKMGQTIYFDQQGSLSNKFGIKASPAMVEQQGLKLKIQEFGLKGKKFKFKNKNSRY